MNYDGKVRVHIFDEKTDLNGTAYPDVDITTES